MLVALAFSTSIAQHPRRIRRNAERQSECRPV
jgi:hypothetical protein